MSETPEQLDEVARRHRQAEGFTPRLIACRARTLERLLPVGRVLDLGCADGLLTAALGRRHASVVGVDASPLRLERAAAATTGLDGVELVESLFEAYAPAGNELFDAAVLSCVLEHVEEPVALLRHVVRLVRPEGLVVAITPNGGSLHRRAGVLMGLLRDLGDRGEADHELEHERVYEPAGLRADFEAAGLEPAEQGGHLIKPLPNDAMAELSPELVDAYEELGRQLPELAAELWCAGRRA